MLSRVANSIYWMSRYLERAENIARMIDVNFLLHLDGSTELNEQWEPIVRITGDWEYFYKKYKVATKENVIDFLTFDKEYPSSIYSCLYMARENARSVREIIDSEMWEQINKFYLFLNNPSSKKLVLSEPNEFFYQVKLNCNLFFGITNSVMLHNESWHFYNLGQLIERADKTSRIIDVKYYHILPNIKDVGTTYDDMQWAALLKSVSGFEMYRKVYKKMTPDRIIEFLILNKDFPRSISFCLKSASDSLTSISQSKDIGMNKPELILEELISELASADINTIISSGLHDYIDSFQIKLNDLGDSIRSLFFDINNNTEFCFKELDE